MIEGSTVTDKSRVLCPHVNSPYFVKFHCDDMVCYPSCFKDHFQQNLMYKTGFGTSTVTEFTGVFCPKMCPGSVIGETAMYKILGKDTYQEYQSIGLHILLQKDSEEICPIIGCGKKITKAPNTRDMMCSGCQVRA